MNAEGTEAEVLRLPDCDICLLQGRGSVEAHYDGKTQMGPWANMCDWHFDFWGTGLGLGRGQRLTLTGGPG